MLGLFKRKKVAEPVESVEAVPEQVELGAAIPLDQNFLFDIKGRKFAGSCIQKKKGELHIACENGLFIAKEEVRIVREATQSESSKIQVVKDHIRNNHVIRFLRLVDLG